MHINSATARLTCIYQRPSNAEITQYADFHGRNAKLKIMHKTKIKDEREPEIK